MLKYGRLMFKYDSPMLYFRLILKQVSKQADYPIKMIEFSLRQYAAENVLRGKDTCKRK